MVSEIEVVKMISDLIKNGISLDGKNIFECNLFMKDLNHFLNTETTLSAHYSGGKITIESIFFDPLLSVELEKSTLQCIPITDEGWMDAVYEILKFIHIRKIEELEKQQQAKKKEEENNKEFDWI